MTSSLTLLRSMQNCTLTMIESQLYPFCTKVTTKTFSSYANYTDLRTSPQPKFAAHKISISFQPCCRSIQPWRFATAFFSLLSSLHPFFTMAWRILQRKKSGLWLVEWAVNKIVTSFLTLVSLQVLQLVRGIYLRLLLITTEQSQCISFGPSCFCYAKEATLIAIAGVTRTTSRKWMWPMLQRIAALRFSVVSATFAHNQS